MRANNFDAIRLLLAVTVYLSHTYALSGNPSLRIVSTIFDARVAVAAFFVISGFLIFMSYENSRSLRSYFEKRARRVYPAYVAVVLLCAFGGAFITSAGLSAYVGPGLWEYLAANLTFLNFLHGALPGVFTHHLHRDVNAALWTIKVEVMFYLSVPVLAVIVRRYGVLPVLGASYIFSLLYRFYCERMGAVELMKQLPGQMCFFVGGALLYYYFNRFERFSGLLLILATVVAAIECSLGIVVLCPLALAVIVIYAACFLPSVTRFRPKWDLSYGVYICHFPVLQVLVDFGWLSGNPIMGVLLGAAIVLALAGLSWNLVEKRFLERRLLPARGTAATAAKSY